MDLIDDGMWRIRQAAYLGDDPVKQSNLFGYIAFADAGPNTRTTQVTSAAICRWADLIARACE